MKKITVPIVARLRTMREPLFQMHSPTSDSEAKAMVALNGDLGWGIIPKPVAIEVTLPWWMSKRARGIQMPGSNMPPCIEYYVPWWGWPFALWAAIRGGYKSKVRAL